MNSLRITLVLILFAFSSQAQEKTPIQVSAGVDFGSAYVFRGTTFNSGAVAQPWLSVTKGWFTYTTWNNINLHSEDNVQGTFDGRESTEVDHLFTAALPFKTIDMTATFACFVYPTMDWKADRELKINIQKMLHPLAVPYAKINYMIGGDLQNRFYTIFGVKGGGDISPKFSYSYDVCTDWEYQGYTDAKETGIRYWQSKAGVGYTHNETWGVSANANYVDQLDKDLLSDAAYDVKFFGSIGVYVNL